MGNRALMMGDILQRGSCAYHRGDLFIADGQIYIALYFASSATLEEQFPIYQPKKSQCQRILTYYDVIYSPDLSRFKRLDYETYSALCQPILFTLHKMKNFANQLKHDHWRYHGAIDKLRVKLQSIEEKLDVSWIDS